jgi:HD-like signal output (HDOD) protein
MQGTPALDRAERITITNLMNQPLRKPKRTPPSPDEMAQGLGELPSVPAILPKLLTILSDPASSMEDVLSLIKVEPGIASRVLQLGNSAYYSQSGRCSTLEQGVNRLGFQKIYEVVAFAVSSELLLRRLSAYGIEPDELWLRSVGCALASAQLAPSCDLDADEAYTAGLFHAVGLIAMDAWATTHEPGLAFEFANVTQETTAAERKVFGFANPAAAAVLLRNWGFTPGLCETVRWQYSPEAAGRHRRAASLVQVAKWLQATARMAPAAALPAPPDASVLASIRLPAGDLEKRVEDLRAELERARQILADV